MDSFDYDQCYRDIEEAKRVRAEREAHLTALTAERDGWKREFDVRGERLADVENERDALKEVRSQLERALETQRADNERLRAELAEMTALFHDADQAAIERNGELSAAETQLTELREQMETQSLELRGLAEGYELQLRELRELREAAEAYCKAPNHATLDAMVKVLAKLPTT